MPRKGIEQHDLLENIGDFHGLLSCSGGSGRKFRRRSLQIARDGWNSIHSLNLTSVAAIRAAIQVFFFFFSQKLAMAVLFLNRVLF